MLRLGLLFLPGLNILHHDLSYMSSYFASFCPVSFEGTSFLFFKLFFHFLLIIFWCNICIHHLVVWMTVRHQTANLGHFLGMSPVVKIRKNNNNNNNNYTIEHDIVESSSNRIDCISSSLNRGWFEMVLELLFEYGEHESSSVAQILNVVRILLVELWLELG